MTNQCPSCRVQIEPRSSSCSSCGCSFAQQTTQVAGRTIVESAAGANQTVVPLPVSADGFATTLQSSPQLPSQRTSGPSAGLREHVILAVDGSGSMAKEFEPGVTKIAAAQRAAINTILAKKQIDPFDLVGLVAFNDVARVVHPLTESGAARRGLCLAAQSLTADGGTDINAALVCCERSFDWSVPNVVRKIVILTDGHGGNPLRTSENIKARGAYIEVVGIGPTPAAVDEKLLRVIASSIAGEVQYRFIRDASSLLQHFTRVGEKTRVA